MGYQVSIDASRNSQLDSPERLPDVRHRLQVRARASLAQQVFEIVVSYQEGHIDAASARCLSSSGLQTQRINHVSRRRVPLISIIAEENDPACAVRGHSLIHKGQDHPLLAMHISDYEGLCRHGICSLISNLSDIRIEESPLLHRHNAILP